MVNVKGGKPIPVFTSVVTPGGSYTQVHNDLDALCSLAAVISEHKNARKLFVMFKLNENNRSLMSRRHNSEISLV
jgi:hypothetical protein